MKTHLLLILLVSTVLAVSQDRPRPQQPPLDILCPTTTSEQRTQGYVLNPQVVSIELPPYPQDAQEKRVQGHCFVQVVVNENGEVIAALPVESCSEKLWAASVKAAVTARFDPKTLAKEPGKVAGILIVQFWNGKVELQKMPDPKSPTTGPPIRRGIVKP